MSRKANFTVGQVDACGRLEKLYQHVAAVDLKHATAANLAVRQFDLAKLVVFNALDLFYKHKRTRNFFDGSIFSDHCSALL